MQFFVFILILTHKYNIMNALEIKKKRKELGLTQADLAKSLGVSLRTVSNYEKGEVIPETKQGLLHTILSNNSTKEPEAIYHKTNPYNKRIADVQDKIEEIDKIIGLAKETSDQQTVLHYTELKKLLEKQIQLIEIAKKDHEEDI